MPPDPVEVNTAVADAPGGSSQTSRDEWSTYFESLSEFDVLTCDSKALKTRLELLASSLFSAERFIAITGVDANEDAAFKPTAVDYKGKEKVEGWLQQPLPKFRLISIVRRHSLSPLRISKELMLKIMSRHSISPVFFDLLFSFRSREELSEKGHSLWTPVNLGTGTREICYQLRYIERNDHEEGDRWSERQIGVYHKFDSDVKGPVTLVLLHARPSSSVQQRVEEYLHEGHYRQDRPIDALSLHILVLTTYLDNWRWYMDDLGQICLSMENKGFTTELEEHHSLTFRSLQELRNLEANMTAASVILQATQELLQRFERIAATLHAESEGQSIDDGDATTEPQRGCKDLATKTKHMQSPEMRALARAGMKCDGYLKSIGVMQSRVNKLIQLLSDGLSHQGQKTSVEISQNLYLLTKKSIDDNAVVRVVTVITVIYLPTQFVTSFFGMNIMSFQSGGIRFSRDWWLFLATALPLTGVTLIVLGLAIWGESRKRKGNSDQSQRTSTSDDSASSLEPKVAGA